MSRNTFAVWHVLDPNCEQVEGSIHVTMDAIADDPFINAILGGQTTDPSSKIYYRFVRAYVLAALVDGELWVAEDPGEGGRIVGVALWFPPGKLFLASEEQRGVAGMDEIIADLGQEIRRWWTDYFVPAATQQTDMALGRGGKLASYHLQILAVHPAYQNLGVGRALMLAQASRAWAQGKRVCWETVRKENVAKYQRWGGRVLNTERYEGNAEGTALSRWIMDLPSAEGTGSGGDGDAVSCQ